MSSIDINKKRLSSLTIQSDTFIELFEADRRRIYAYIYAFVMDTDAADEIFQETCVLLWRDFEKFETGTSFSKWANGIVFNRVRSYRRQEKKHGLCLSEQVVGELADKISHSEETEKRWQAFQTCRSKLPPPLQQLYTDFYVNDASASDIANRAGKSVFAIRKSVQKLRKMLIDCIDRKQRVGEL